MTGEQTAQAVPIEARHAALQQAIGEYLAQGYRVLSQTDTTAQLVKPKQFGTLWFILWLLTGVLWIVYLVYYLAVKREGRVYLQVDPSGVVHRT